MPLPRSARIEADFGSIIAGATQVSLGKARPATRKPRALRLLPALLALVYAPCKADVPAPTAAPPVPAGSYCSSIYTELNGDLQAFNTVLATPPTWTPIPGGATLYGANLQWADSNTGPSLSSPNYFETTVHPQLQALQALGIQAVSVPVLFPVLYEPFFGSQAALQPYLDFYQQVAQAVRGAGLKLIIDNEIVFSNDIEAGWTNMNAYYSTLSWPQYMAARAEMAATIAQVMQPDYLMLANEPDTEAAQTGQENLNNPVDAALMVAGEIAAVQAEVLTGGLSPAPKLGAGFGTWMAPEGTASLLNYINAYDALPLDYIDFHLLPINTTNNDNFLDNSLTIAQMAAAAGKPVAVSQAWATKEAAGEWSTLSAGVIRSRGAFSFWAPLDGYFQQTAQALANYTQMIYLVPEMPVFLFAYQTYGGTADNGGAANCTCTTASCSDSDIMNTENSLATVADQQSTYTSTAFRYYHQLVRKPDTIPPSVPVNLTGTPAYTAAYFSWGASTDNVGVAGYNVYRCTPPTAGQPCTGIWIANSTLPSFNDTTLTTNTAYNYQVQAFDFANNNSPLSQTLSLETYRTTADPATNLVATAVSTQEIDLSWAPPSNATGLSQYLVLSGTSASNLQQLTITSPSVTTYRNGPLAPGTTYYYGVVAMEEGIDAAMPPIASATTLPLPSPPSNVAGTPTAATITLTWQERLQANGLPIGYYEILQGTKPGQLTQVATKTDTSYTATSLNGNTAYYFEIVAVDTGHNDSVPSNQISVTTLPTPAAPVNVAATANSGTKVTITWSENISPTGLPIQAYNIFRGTSPAGLTQLAARTGLQFIDTGVSPNITYYYAIEAVDTGGDVSPMSGTVQVATPPLPAAPVNLAATANAGTQVTIIWFENIPAEGLPIQGYTIFRGTSPTGLIQLAARTGLQFIDTGASPNTTYYYAVEAVDTSGDVSPMSATVLVTTPAMPAAPVNVAVTANGGTEVTLTWSENIPPAALPIQAYNVFRGTSPAGLTKLNVRVGLEFIDTGVSPSTTYYYAVEAVDTGNDVSPMSATVQVTTPN
jgi:fibronectin type 3 domain-containing protein